MTWEHIVEVLGKDLGDVHCRTLELEGTAEAGWPANPPLASLKPRVLK